MLYLPYAWVLNSPKQSWCQTKHNTVKYCLPSHTFCHNWKSVFTIISFSHAIVSVITLDFSFSCFSKPRYFLPCNTAHWTIKGMWEFCSQQCKSQMKKEHHWVWRPTATVFTYLIPCIVVSNIDFNLYVAMGGILIEEVFSRNYWRE